MDTLKGKIHFQILICIKLNICRVTKKLTQFFFNDVLDGDRNRLAENLVVGTNGGMYTNRIISFIEFFLFISRSNSLCHRISMGSCEISHQAIAKKSFGNHFQGSSKHFCLNCHA